MSTTSQGRKYEKEVEAILIRKGYEAELVNKKIVWIWDKKQFKRIPITTHHDFFGKYDVIAKKSGHPILLIQATVWEHVSVKRRLLADEKETLFYLSQIWARMRKEKKPHYRILSAEHNYEWNGVVEMIAKPLTGTLAEKAMHSLEKQSA